MIQVPDARIAKVVKTGFSTELVRKACTYSYIVHSSVYSPINSNLSPLRNTLTLVYTVETKLHFHFVRADLVLGEACFAR